MDMTLSETFNTTKSKVEYECKYDNLRFIMKSDVCHSRRTRPGCGKRKIRMIYMIETERQSAELIDRRLAWPVLESLEEVPR